MSIAALCELAVVAVREAEEEYRLADTRDAAVLLALTRTFHDDVFLYVAKLQLAGAQIAKRPPLRGDS